MSFYDPSDMNKDVVNHVLQFAVKQDFELVFYNDNKAIGLRFSYGSNMEVKSLITFSKVETYFNNIEQAIAKTKVSLAFGINFGKEVIYQPRFNQFYLKDDYGCIALPGFLNKIIIAILTYWSDSNKVSDYFYLQNRQAFMQKMKENAVKVVVVDKPDLNIGDQ